MVFKSYLVPEHTPWAPGHH